MCQSEKGNSKVLKIFYMQKCEGNVGEAVDQESCDEMETVREFTYLGDMLSAGGG